MEFHDDFGMLDVGLRIFFSFFFFVWFNARGAGQGLGWF